MRPARWLLPLLMLAGPPGQAAAPETPERYAERWTLELAPDAGVLRLPLPAQVLAQVQTADLRDLRVFNAAGQAVPLALVAPRAQAAAAAPIALPVLPIRADARQDPAAAAALSLRIEGGPAGRVVRLDSPAAADAAPAPEGALLGLLVDTRTQEQALEAIELDAQWPAARPFTFRLDTSTDLRQWRPLAEVTAYRAPDDAVLAPARVALGGAVLRSHYLRITWDATATPDAVQVRGVRLLPRTAAPAAERLAVPLELQAGAGRDPHVLEWRLPFGVPLAALELRLAQAPALVPVRVLARRQREQAWTPLARHVVFNLPRDGQARHSPPLELGRAAWRDWRVEADPATPGFGAPPQVVAWLAPRQLVFVASGAPPFTLAAGRADAPRALLPVASLIPDYQAGAESRLPVARLAPAAQPADAPPAIAATRADNAPDLRRWALWAILVAGVLVLAAMAWKLVRQLDPPAGGAEPPA